MSNRVLLEQIIVSKSLAAVSADAERVYWRAVVSADDYGWLNGDPELLLPLLLPWKARTATVAEMEGWLDELLRETHAGHSLAELWVLDGKAYLHLNGAASRNGQPIHFTVRASKSKHPVAAALDRATRVDTCAQLRAIASGCEQRQTVASRNGNGNGNGNVQQSPAAAAADGGAETPELELTPEGTPPGVDTPAKAQAKPPKNPDVPRLILHYTSEFKRLRGGKPLIEVADAAAAAKVLSGRTLVEAQELVTKFLTTPDEWTEKRGLLRLRDLPAAVTKILARASPGGGGGGGQPKRGRGGMLVPEA